MMRTYGSMDSLGRQITEFQAARIVGKALLYRINGFVCIRTHLVFLPGYYSWCCCNGSYFIPAQLTTMITRYIFRRGEVQLKPVCIFPYLLLTALSAISGAQTYPSKPIRMIAPEVGGGNDFVARQIAQGLTGNLGQQVIVDNRGGSVIAAADIVLKAPADGHTLLFYSSSLWTMPLLRDNVRYDVARDFSPISAAATSPNTIVVHPSLDVKTVKELIMLAEASPGKLNYASGSSGSANHLAAELFKSLARVNIVRIPYKGTGPALNDVSAGQVQLMFPAAGSVAPHIKSGRLKALAVTSAEPSALAPGLPTAAASGLPGYEAVATSGVFAPGRTPAPLVNLLNREIVQILARADVKERLFRSGGEVVGGTPNEFAAKIKSEMTRLGKVIREAGIRAE